MLMGACNFTKPPEVNNYLIRLADIVLTPYHSFHYFLSVLCLVIVHDRAHHSGVISKYVGGIRAECGHSFVSVQGVKWGD